MRKLMLIRGLPGSGKSTFAEMVDGRSFAADDFFYDEDGCYDFKPSMLQEAHQECLKAVTRAVTGGSNWNRIVMVHNTFSQRWEMEPYLALVRNRDEWQVIVADLYDAELTDEELYHRNVHDVPLEVIQKMRGRWEHDWRNGNPIPPWDRKGE